MKRSNSSDPDKRTSIRTFLSGFKLFKAVWKYRSGYTESICTTIWKV